MQRVGQATGAGDMSDADQALYNQMMQAGTDAASQAADAISTTAPSAQTGAQAGALAPTSTALSPTTLVIGGVLVLGLLWFLTRK